MSDVTRNYRKVREGVVVSDKMDKTIVVQIEDRTKHSLYGKVVSSRSKLKAHDENNEAGMEIALRLPRLDHFPQVSAGV